MVRLVQLIACSKNLAGRFCNGSEVYGLVSLHGHIKRRLFHLRMAKDFEDLPMKSTAKFPWQYSVL